MNVKEVPKKQMICPIGQKTDWLTSRIAVSDKGGLPSNVLHDDYLNGIERRYQAFPDYWPAWARQLYAKPEKNRKFQRGQDIFDRMNRTVIPWDEIARLGLAGAIIGPKIALFVDPGIKPEGAKPERYREMNVLVIHPESITIITPAIQLSGTCGKVDEGTGIPLEVDPKLWGILTPDEKRFLLVANALSVRPIVRYGNGDDGQGIGADYWNGDLLGAAYVISSSD